MRKNTKKNTKKFDVELHARCDQRSKDIIVDYMKKQGFAFHSNEDKYGLDLISDFDKPKVAIECEQRDLWSGPVFPLGYPSVHIPARKLRLLGHRNIHYVVINKEYTHFGICLGKNLLNYLGCTQVVNNSSGTQNERFILIPRDEFKWLPF